MTDHNLTTLEEGDQIQINTHTQTFTVTQVMFDGEMIDLKGPRGGEKSLVQNVNDGSVAVVNGSRKEGTLTELTAL